MKLKKIASLMLAGIMAVSMLAGCKSGTPDPDDNGGASSNTTSSFTESVLSKTNPKTKALLGASDNAKLDNAVAFAAVNDSTEDNLRAQVTSIKWADDSWTSVALAESMMDNANFRGEDKFVQVDFSKDAAFNDKTYWTLGVVSSTLDDNAVANLVADALDNLVAANKVAVSNDDYTYDYDVRVAKSVCKNEDVADASDDYIIIGIAITCHRDAVKY